MLCLLVLKLNFNSSCSTLCAHFRQKIQINLHMDDNVDYKDLFQLLIQVIQAPGKLLLTFQEVRTHCR